MCCSFWVIKRNLLSLLAVKYYCDNRMHILPVINACAVLTDSMLFFFLAIPTCNSLDIFRFFFQGSFFSIIIHIYSSSFYPKPKLTKIFGTESDQKKWF
jgi:hypothetical protein